MNRTFRFILISGLTLLLIYCKTTKKQEKTAQKSSEAAASKNAPLAKVPAPAGVVKTEEKISFKETAATNKLMEIANGRWAGTSLEELGEGKNIYTGKCTKCHSNYPIEEFSEKKWLHEIDDMSPKAKLTSEEKLKLTKYILSYREMKTVTNGN